MRQKSLYTMIPLINLRTVCMLRQCGSLSFWPTFLYFYLFCLTAKGSNLNLNPDLKAFTRKLKCREKIWNIEFKDNNLLKSNTFCNLTNSSREKCNIIIENTESIKLINESNVSKEEWNALTATNNPNIVIQKADKINAFVVLHKEFYFKKLVKCNHLDSNTFVKIDSNIGKNVFSKLDHLIDKKNSECLTKKEPKHLPHYQWKSSNF